MTPLHTTKPIAPTIWAIYGMAPKPAGARGRIVLGLTGDTTLLRGISKTNHHTLRERELIYAAIKAMGNPTRDDIAADTGIDPETVTARLNWLSTHALVRCHRAGVRPVWRIVGDD